MTVLLVLAFFLVFIVLDYFLNRRKALVTTMVTAPATVPAAFGGDSAGDLVDGFQVPENVSYHPGHSWLVHERKNLVRVGADEFATALLGRIEKIEAPKPGQWIRQGQKVISFYRDGVKTEMVSPTEGEVKEVNNEIVNHPEQLRKDPYGKGWLVAVHVPDEENTERNLVPKTLVRAWMRQSVEHLYSLQPNLAGAVAADGGRPADDLLEALPDADWKQTTGEFFLTR